MSLINFSQIKGGKQALKDLEALKGLTLEEISLLDAAKTQVTLDRVKRDENGEIVKDDQGQAVIETVDLLVSEYLQEVETTLNGAEGSLEERLSAAEEALARPMHDRVRVQGTVDAAGVPTLVTELVAPVVQPEEGEYAVYSEENQNLFNAEGEILTANVVAGTEEAPVAIATFTNGLPHDKVVKYISEAGEELTLEQAEQLDMAVEEEVTFVPVAEGTVFKAYPVATYTLGTLPLDAMLDEEELALVAYGSAIAKISADLAKDAAIIEEIIARVKTLALDSVVKQITDALAERLTAVEGRLDQAEGRLDAIEAIKNVQVDLDLSGLTVTEIDGEQRVVISDFAVPFSAEVVSVTEDKTILFVNGVSYFEGKAFTLNREAKTISWGVTTMAEGEDENGLVIQTPVYNELFPLEADFELTLAATVVTKVEPAVAPEAPVEEPETVEGE